MYMYFYIIYVNTTIAKYVTTLDSNNSYVFV